jgi:hypothetical protein
METSNLTSIQQFAEVWPKESKTIAGDMWRPVRKSENQPTGCWKTVDEPTGCWKTVDAVVKRNQVGTSYQATLLGRECGQFQSHDTRFPDEQDRC